MNLNIKEQIEIMKKIIPLIILIFFIPAVSAAPYITINEPKNTTYEQHIIPLNVSINETVKLEVTYTVSMGETYETGYEVDNVNEYVRDMAVSKGVYTVKLTATNENGTDTKSVTFTQIKPSFGGIYITDCADLPSGPEVYYLTQSILNRDVTVCMRMLANYTALNCMGNKIDGVGSNVAVWMGYDSDVIHDCEITDWYHAIDVMPDVEIQGIGEILRNVLINNAYGIVLFSTKKITNLKIYDNKIFGDTAFLISGVSPISNNRIYNNLFNTSFNFDLRKPEIFGTNYWNTTKKSRTNIVGGGWVGGNFWGNPTKTGYSDTCVDVDKDKICDEPYVLSSNNIDYLPLVISPPADVRIIDINFEAANVYPNPTGYAWDYWVKENSVRTFSVTVKNFGNQVTTVLIGFALAENITPGIGYTGAWCNQECFLETGLTNQPYYREISNDKWAGRVTLNPGDVKTVLIKFYFKDMFKPHMKLDVGAAVWLDRGQKDLVYSDLLDARVAEDLVEIQRFEPPRQLTRVEIRDIEFSDNEPTLDDIIKVSVHVKNTGKYDLPLGYVELTLIQDEPHYAFCSKDCYTDGLGDFVEVRNVEANGGEVVVSRMFKIRSDKFVPTNAARMGAGVRWGIPGDFQLISEILWEPFTILSPEEKLDACPVSLKASRMEASLGDLVDYGVFIQNYRASWNFKVKMMIGVWDAISGEKYREQRTAIKAPCNIECYRDKEYPLISFVNLSIPKGEVGTIRRTFIIPEYFYDLFSFDVGVEVWKDVKKVGGEYVGEKLVCAVYFKNVTNISTEPSLHSWATGLLSSGVNWLLSMSSNAFGIQDIEVTKIVVWTLITVMSLLIIGIVLKSPPIIGIFAVFLILVGAYIRWYPPWLTIVLIIIAGFIMTKIIGKEVF